MAKKTTILMIGPVAPPVGGMGVSLDNLITSNLKDGYDIIVLDTTGLRTRYGKVSLVSGLFYQFRLVLKLVCVLVRKRPVIVHLHMASFFYFYRRTIDVFICKLFRKKVIFHLHGGKFIEFYKNSPIVGKLVIRYTLLLSNKVIALSQYWADFISTLTMREKVVVIPNGVACSDFVREKYKKKELGFSKSRISILFMSPIGKRKGAFDLLEIIPRVVSKAPDVIFIFCGGEEFQGELGQFLDTVKERDLSGYLRYIGEVSGREKFYYYLSSDIFVLPSYAENLPNSLLEAMAAALPVVVSDVGAIPEIIKDGSNGFIIKAGDLDAMADRLVILAKDSGLRKSMGESNALLIKEKYDMKIIAEKTAELYEELLKTRKL